jgi:hypothetical protein
VLAFSRQLDMARLAIEQSNHKLPPGLCPVCVFTTTCALTVPVPAKRALHATMALQ